jgi:hypothetical protein
VESEEGGRRSGGEGDAQALRVARVCPTPSCMCVRRDLHHACSCEFYSQCVIVSGDTVKMWLAEDESSSSTSSLSLSSSQSSPTGALRSLLVADRLHNRTMAWGGNGDGGVRGAREGRGALSASSGATPPVSRAAAAPAAVAGSPPPPPPRQPSINATIPMPTTAAPVGGGRRGVGGVGGAGGAGAGAGTGAGAGDVAATRRQLFFHGDKSALEVDKSMAFRWVEAWQELLDARATFIQVSEAGWGILTPAEKLASILTDDLLDEYEAQVQRFGYSIRNPSRLGDCALYTRPA